jgi:hypothetical protein
MNLLTFYATGITISGQKENDRTLFSPDFLGIFPGRAWPTLHQTALAQDNPSYRSASIFIP